MKRYIKFSQPIFAGTKYDKKAAQILVDSGMYDNNQANEIIDALFHQDIHAFVHAPSWTEKYLVGIARMCVEESGNNPNRVADFLNDSVDVFDSFINYVKANRDKLGGADFDSKFMRTMKYQDVVDMLDEIQSQYDAESKDALSKMSFSDSSNYKLVPIDSYDQMHELFGGHWTGDGSSDKYAGGGGTAWCHANSESVYDTWVRKGRFFVLADKNFKKIPFNAESNEKYAGKDRYGNSLLALLVSRSGTLKACTLRCNHVGVGSDADHQYRTYAELSKIVGFNVEEAVSEYCDEFTDDDSYLIIKNNEVAGVDTFEIDIGDITDVVIPNGVTRIGSGAFAKCSNLTSIKIPDSVTSIGPFAFSDCHRLPSIAIPDGVTSIGYRAFSECHSLKSIKIPDSVTKIGEGAFSYCRSLTNINIPDGVLVITADVFNGCNSLTSITIPDSVTGIGDYAFPGCNSLQSITIPDSVTNIGKSAFYGCRSLTNITIPDTVTSIGDDAFSNCSSLTIITIPDGVTSIGKRMFYKCNNLTSITIPYSVTSIGDWAFSVCNSLTRITIPDSVMIVGDYAFWGCSNLLNITISDSVESIGVESFHGCKKLNQIILPSRIDIDDLDIPDTCEIIRR